MWSPSDKFLQKKNLISTAVKYFDIKFYNIESFYRKIKTHNKKNLFWIKNLEGLKEKLNKHKPEIGVMIGDDSLHLEIGKICRNNFNMKMVYLNINLCPESFTFLNFKIILKTIFDNYIFNYINQLVYKSIFSLTNRFYNKKVKNTFQFDYSIIGGKSGYNIPVVKNSKKVIETLSYDFFESLKYKKSKKNYTIFLDEDLYDHRDYKLLNNQKFVSIIYFKEINQFFNLFEKKYNTEVIVSLHPRTKNINRSKRYFNNRKCFVGKSHELVSNCKYVLLHPSTTALNLPIIYKKPMIFLTTDELLKKLEIKARIVKRQLMFKHHFINLSKYKSYIYPKNFNFIDHNAYGKYLRDYIAPNKIKNPKNGIWGHLFRYLA